MSNVQNIREKPHRDMLLQEQAAPLGQAGVATAQPGWNSAQGAIDGLEAGVTGRMSVPTNDAQRLPANAGVATTGLEEVLAGRTVADLPIRSLGQSIALERDLTPATPVLERLNALDGATLKLAEQQGPLAEKLLSATQKLRAGVMLSVSDGLGVYTQPATRVPRDVASHVAEVVASEKVEGKLLATVQNGLTNVASRFPAGMDVNAFVQAVLRESYLLQQEIMGDYALRMEGYNKQRRWIREQLNKARELASALADGGTIPDDLPFFNVDSGAVEDYWTKYEQDTAASDSVFGTADGQGNDIGASAQAATTASVSVGGEFRSGALVADGSSIDDLNKLRTLCARLYEYGATNPGWDMIIKTVQNHVGGDVASMGGSLKDLSATEFQALLHTMLMAAMHPDLKKAGGLTTDVEAQLVAMARNATDAQLAGVDNLGSADFRGHFLNILRAADPSLATSVEERITRFRLIRDELPEAIKAVPEVADLVAQVLREGVENCTVMSALQARLRVTPTAQLNAIASAMAGLPDGDALLQKLFGKDYTLTHPAANEGSDSAVELAGASNSLEEGGPASEVTAGGHPIPTDKKQFLDDYIENLNNALATVGEDAQMGAFELQEAQQKAAMYLQLMSNLSKAMHDTTMAIIRNLAG